MSTPQPYHLCRYPVYKAEACLEELYRRLLGALEAITPGPPVQKIYCLCIGSL